MRGPIQLGLVAEFVSIGFRAGGTAVETPRRERCRSVSCELREPAKMGGSDVKAAMKAYGIASRGDMTAR
eukprot:6214471-Pleurochrysis_carterae.AAC.1